MLKVIGMGFGRSGTLSVKAALETLGFDKCYHFSDMLDKHPEHAAQWLAASRGGIVDWDALFDGYRSTVYLPPGWDASSLFEKYPDAKVVLITRDPERWYESTKNTLYRYNRLTWYRKALLLGLGMIWRHYRELYEVWSLQQQTLWHDTFKDRFEDREFAIATYQQVIRSLQQAVAEERLLLFDVKQGWGPLCEFLEVPVPDDPFPRLNDTVTFVSWRTGDGSGLLRWL